MNAFTGELAALAAAAGFTVTSVCYTLAGRKINAVTSIAMSLPVSWLIVMAIHGLTTGELLPGSAGIERWFFLSISGILAFVIASYFMLNAYQHIGPGLTMVIAAFAPVLGALLAWLFVGQTLPASAAVGIAVVIIGIVWVVIQRSKTRSDPVILDLRRGVLHAALGTLAQAAAFVFASQGVSGGFLPLSASLIRITAGTIALWLFIAFQGKVQATTAIFKNDRRLFFQLAGAAVSGPVISGWLLLLSFQFIPVGVATTLSHTTAIMLIPVSYFLFNERVTLQAIIGTMVTITGIAILFT